MKRVKSKANLRSTLTPLTIDRRWIVGERLLQIKTFEKHCLLGFTLIESKYVGLVR